MKKAIKRIAMLFVVCGLAVSMSFGEFGYGNIDMLKAEMEEYETYLRGQGKDIKDIVDCEDKYNRFHFYCEAKLALLLLEEAKAKNIDYYSYDMQKFVWGDERFEYFRGYSRNLDIGFSAIKDGFKENREKREESEARKAVFREWSK